ncbi:MAG: hypothetical protein V2A58_00955 [Planctomycetota bacterium]
MEYRIGASDRKCSSCGKEVRQGALLYSAVFEAGETFERRDYCEGCWSAPPDACYSFWRTRVEEKEPQKKRLDAEIVLGFFDELQSKTAPAELNFRYVIALLLMRKRILRFADVERSDTGEFLILRRPREGRTYRVAVRSLSEEEIGSLTDQVARVLAASTLTDEEEVDPDA